MATEMNNGRRQWAKQLAFLLRSMIAEHQDAINAPTFAEARKADGRISQFERGLVDAIDLLFAPGEPGTTNAREILPLQVEEGLPVRASFPRAVAEELAVVIRNLIRNEISIRLESFHEYNLGEANQLQSRIGELLGGYTDDPPADPKGYNRDYFEKMGGDEPAQQEKTIPTPEEQRREQAAANESETRTQKLRERLRRAEAVCAQILQFERVHGRGWPFTWRSEPTVEDHHHLDRTRQAFIDAMHEFRVVLNSCEHPTVETFYNGQHGDAGRTDVCLDCGMSFEIGKGWVMRSPMIIRKPPPAPVDGAQEVSHGG